MTDIQSAHTVSFKIAELCRELPLLRRLTEDAICKQFKIHMDPFSRSVIAPLKTGNTNEDITTIVML